MKINAPIITCLPRPFIILQGIQESEHPVMSAEMDGVILTVTGLDCAYAWSQPNGFTNYSVPDGY
jgi:hypothetical protein